jgi:hypothetical protein
MDGERFGIRPGTNSRLSGGAMGLQSGATLSDGHMSASIISSNQPSPNQAVKRTGHLAAPGSGFAWRLWQAERNGAHEFFTLFHCDHFSIPLDTGPKEIRAKPSG